jgi:ABC-2 type transport system ATP-binding protein
MRQRLGVAAALLGDPQVLILDEPGNGLDPAGIRWMRSLMRSLAEAGRTVLVSSHQLLEMEQVADDVVIIAAGRVVAAGPLKSVVGPHDGLEEAFLALTSGSSGLGDIR